MAVLQKLKTLGECCVFLTRRLRDKEAGGVESCCYDEAHLESFC
jgi:hypothetical protein